MSDKTDCNVPDVPEAVPLHGVQPDVSVPAL